MLIKVSVQVSRRFTSSLSLRRHAHGTLAKAVSLKAWLRETTLQVTYTFTFSMKKALFL